MSESSISVLWPIDFVDPKDKQTPQYLNSIGVALLNSYNYNSVNGSRYITYGRADNARLVLIKQYGNGQQPEEKYMDINPSAGDEKIPNGTTQNSKWARKGYSNMDWETTGPAPLFRRIVDSAIGTEGQRVQVESLNAEIKNKKLLQRAEIIFDAQVKPLMQKLGIPTKKNLVETADPVKLDVYELLGGFKQDIEIALEKIAEHGFSLSHYDMIEKNMKTDFMDYNFALARDVYDPNTGAAKVEYVEVNRAGIAYTDAFEADRSPFFFVINKYSIDTLRDLLIASGVDEETTERLLIKAAKASFSTMNQGNAGNMTTNFDNYLKRDTVTNRWRYDSFMVEVLEFEYITKDTKFTKETRRDGILKVGLDKWGEWVNKDHKKTVTYDIHTIIEGKYIVGADYCIGGYQPNVKRVNKHKPILSVCYYKINGRSMTENAIPRYDQIQMINLKLQNAIREAKLKGIAVDIAALNIGNVGGQMYSGKDIIKIYKESGVLMYKATLGQNGKYNSNIPIEEIEGGLGTILTELIAAYQFQMEALLQEMGIAPAIANSSNAPDLVGVGEQQIEATSNALRPLQKGLESIKQQLGRNMILRAVTMIQHDPLVRKYYEGVIGKDLVDCVMALEGMTLDEVALTVSTKISQGQKQAIMQTLANAQTADRNGNVSVDPDDAIEVQRMLDKNDIHAAQRYLSQAIAEKRKKNEEQTAAASAQQAKQLQDLEVTKMQAEIQKAQALAEIEIKKQTTLENIKLQSKLQEINAETQKDVTLLEVEAQVQMLNSVDVGNKIPVRNQM
jgi:hypothetical protein